MSSASARRYLPGRWSDLETLAASGALPPGPGLRADDDSEDAEYEALMAAAEQSAEQQPAGARRVVVVVEGTEVVALHVDTTAGAEVDDELAWFASQELGDLLTSHG